MGSLTLHKYLRVALRSWWVLVVCAATAGVVAYTTATTQPVYRSTATLVVGRSLQANPTETNLQGSHLLAVSYANLALGQPILQRVAEALDLDGGWGSLRDQVEPNAVIDTPFLDISATASSPMEARTIANEVARQLVDIQASADSDGTEGDERDQFVRDQLRTLEAKIDDAENRVAEAQSVLSRSPDAQREQSLNAEVRSLEQLISVWQQSYATLGTFLEEGEQNVPPLSILSPAVADPTPDTPQRYGSTALAALLGLLFGVIGLILWDRYRDTIKSESEVSEELGLTLLGAVRTAPGRGRSKRVFTAGGTPVRAAEDYRIIRSNLISAANSKAVRSILVTSPPGSRGRSTTVANLGSVMAAAGLKTVLVDADLRRPSLHELFELPKTPGLGDFLRSSDMDVEDIQFATPIENVYVIPSGSPLPNPSDSLDSTRMTALLASVKAQFDMVIIDSPPVLAVADAVELAKHVDGVVLVLDAGGTARVIARKSVAAVRFTGARILGAVLNRVPRRPTYVYDGANGSGPSTGPISRVKDATDSSG
jgi:capsular exopolysaccharide synthesis family protein